jgi:hypothetical protein
MLAFSQDSEILRSKFFFQLSACGRFRLFTRIDTPLWKLPA